MMQLHCKTVRAASVLLASAMLATAVPSRASDETDAIATERRCAAEAARVGSVAYVECTDPVALADFKQTLMAILGRSVDIREAVTERTFGAPAKFDEIAALTPAEFMKRLLQPRDAAAQSAKLVITTEVIGAVQEGERVHILVRERTGPLQPSGSTFVVNAVHSYVKRDGQWRMELAGDMKQMKEAITKSLDATD